MLRLYYRIWVDAIKATKSSGTESKNWKLVTIIPISLMMGINLFTLFYWMKIIVNRNLPLFIEIYILGYKALNSFVSVIFTYFIPFVILNYLLIFNGDRYKKLMTTYNDENGKLYKKYTLFTLGIAIIPMVAKQMFF
jgi:hypothetical protein